MNSNRIRSAENIVSASDLAEDVLIKCDYGEIRLFTIQSTVSVDQGSPDGRGGFLLVYQSKSGREYGIVVLTLELYGWKSNLLLGMSGKNTIVLKTK